MKRTKFKKGIITFVIDYDSCGNIYEPVRVKCQAVDGQLIEYCNCCDYRVHCLASKGKCHLKIWGACGAVCGFCQPGEARNGD